MNQQELNETTVEKLDDLCRQDAERQAGANVYFATTPDMVEVLNEQLREDDLDIDEFLIGIDLTTTSITINNGQFIVVEPNDIIAWEDSVIESLEDFEPGTVYNYSDLKRQARLLINEWADARETA